MIGEFLLFCVFLASAGTGSTVGENMAVDPPGSDWVATVRHYSRDRAPQWKFTIQRAEEDQVSAAIFWVARTTRLPGERPPGLVEGRTTNVALAECPALEESVEQLDTLAISSMAGDVPDVEPSEVVFTLDTPDSRPIDLASLAPDHPMVRWANETWDRLVVCAEVSGLSEP